MEEEGEEHLEGFEFHDIPFEMDMEDFTFGLEDGLGDAGDDSSHIMVDQVYTSDSAGGDQDDAGGDQDDAGGDQGGGEGGALDETVGSNYQASSVRKAAEDSTRDEL